MADVGLVVKIPEEMYEQIKDGYVPLGISKYLKNGIPHESVTEFADRCRECGREKVLDKIRAEIQAIVDEERTGNGNINKGVVIGLQMALDTIDRYKAESEET